MIVPSKPGNEHMGTGMPIAISSLNIGSSVSEHN